MPPRGQGRKSGRPSAPAPRAPSTPRQQKYVQYNTRPGEVGTRTGIAMRENVPRNEQGLEDPEAFFHSSPPAASRSNATPGGNGFLTSSPPMPPPPSTGKRRPRMSDMNNDSDEGADPLVADGLLDDEYELEKITPPPITHESSPNPPASVPQRRRKDQDQDENPFRPVAAESPPKANGIDSSSDEDMVSQNGGFDANDLEMDVAGQLQETHINEEEIEDEDSQPVRHRRKSDGTKGPHPVTSSGVPDSVNPTTDAEPIDGDDYSDTGEPFGDTEDHSDASQLFDDNEPDPTGDIEDAEPDLDSNDVSLEQRAIADESGEVTEEGDSVEYPADKAERGIKRTATVTPLKKVKRKSQIAPNEGHQYEGDFVCRRSGRNHFKPLEWWRGEHKEYKQGTFGPEIVSIVRVPDEVTTKPRATSRKPRGRGRGRSQTGRLHSASAAPPEELPGMKYLNMDYEVNSMTTVRDYITGQEVVRKTFLPYSRIQPKPVQDGMFSYQKVFGEDGFIAGGVVVIPPGGQKPAKPSGDNTYLWRGRSHHRQYLSANGPTIFVYDTSSLNNKFDETATLIFSQGRKVTQNEAERAKARQKAAQERRATLAERERDRIELDPEDFERKWAGWDDGAEGTDDGVFSEPEVVEVPEDQSGSSAASASVTPEPQPRASPSPPPMPPKRGPGRPRKNPDEPPKTVTAKRGRPPRRGRSSTRGEGSTRGRGRT